MALLVSNVKLAFLNNSKMKLSIKAMYNVTPSNPNHFLSDPGGEAAIWYNSRLYDCLPSRFSQALLTGNFIGINDGF